MAIATSDARALFTKMIVDVYKERPQVTGFLRSFFKDVVESTKEISIEVQRGTEKVAVDVIRGSIGNRNEMSRSSEKIIIPPYFREYFDAVDLSLYDRLHTSTQIDASVFTAFMRQVAENMGLQQDKVERAYEVQCAQVFETGVVTLVNGDNIDFKRKAASKVDLGDGNYWATDTVDPKATFRAAGKFLREEGKAQGGIYNVLMGDNAYADFVNNKIIREGADILNISQDSIMMPQRMAVGSTLHGEISAGSYRFRLWTYPQVFDNASNVSTPYLNTQNAVFLPEVTRFTLGFAGVPQLSSTGMTVRRGKFVFGDYPDERRASHDFDVKSAGIAIPVAVDQIYTTKVVADA